METQIDLKPEYKMKLKIEDPDTKNYVDLQLEYFGEDPQGLLLYLSATTALRKAMVKLGLLRDLTDKEIKELFMSKDEDPKEKPQEPDLKHQKPEETDNLQKSERPDAEYMKDHELDPDTHGKKKD